MNTLCRCARTVVLRKEARYANYEGQRSIRRWVAATQIEITNRKKRLGEQPEPRRNTFLEWNRSAEIYAFNKRLSEDFDIQLLEQAFIHRSYIVQEEQKQKKIGIENPILDINDNSDFIMKGEKLISDIVHNYLTRVLSNAPESVIVALYDYLLSEEMLAKAALHIGVKDIILTEEHPVAQRTLADTFLALTAALAESVDADHAANFVKDFLIVVLAEKDLMEIWNPPEAEEMLDNILRDQKRSPAEARLIGRTGQNTLLMAYHIGLYSDKQFLGSGFGQTIEEAKKVATMNVLGRMFGLLESSKPIRFDQPVDMSVQNP